MTAYYEPGRYKVRINNQGFNEASTGTAQFWLRFLVLERVEPFDDSFDQCERTTYFAITSKTADWVMGDLRTLGFTGDSFDGVDPRIEGFHSFIGQEVELGCTHEPDQNQQMRERWNLRGVERPIDKDRVRKLNGLLSKKLRRTNGPSVNEAALKITDDEWPFPPPGSTAERG